MKHQHLQSLRAESCYPAFRGFVSFFTVIGYFAAVLVAVFGFVVMGQAGGGVLLGLVVVGGAVLLGIVVKAMSECSLMLADIADCTVHDSAAGATAHALDFDPESQTLAEIIVGKPNR